MTHGTAEPAAIDPSPDRPLPVGTERDLRVIATGSVGR